MIKVRHFKPTCDGCPKAPAMAAFPYVHRCTVYQWVPSAYIRATRCPFNPPQVEAKKKRVRVGQQKQRRIR